MVNTWISLPNLPAPACGFEPETMLLLTDGSVLVHNHANNGKQQWYRLHPDSRGRYECGDWSGPFEMVNERLYFASGVLMDERVFVVGGEYSDDKKATERILRKHREWKDPKRNWSSLGEIFDPVTNTWSPIEKPPFCDGIQGDAPSCVLADGRVIFGDLETGLTHLGPTDRRMDKGGGAHGQAFEMQREHRRREQ